MDLMQMLPLLMMMNGGKGKGGAPDMSALLNMLGGNFGGSQKGNNGGSTLPDMATMMQLMNMLGNANKGNPTSFTSHPNHHKEDKPLNPDLSGLGGMLSPEMLDLLRTLGTRE